MGSTLEQLDTALENMGLGEKDFFLSFFRNVYIHIDLVSIYVKSAMAVVGVIVYSVAIGGTRGRNATLLLPTLCYTPLYLLHNLCSVLTSSFLLGFHNPLQPHSNTPTQFRFFVVLPFPIFPLSQLTAHCHLSGSFNSRSLTA